MCSVPEPMLWLACVKQGIGDKYKLLYASFYKYVSTQDPELLIWCLGCMKQHFSIKRVWGTEVSLLYSHAQSLPWVKRQSLFDNKNSKSLKQVLLVFVVLMRARYHRCYLILNNNIWQLGIESHLHWARENCHAGPILNHGIREHGLWFQDLTLHSWSSTVCFHALVIKLTTLLFFV